MGIKSAFSSSADFSNMSDMRLFVSMMKQKAKIEVDEEGAKASAVTVSEMDPTSPGPQHYEKAEFHAIRPFLYFILEESTRSIFFIGTYCGN
jgi:serpin B